mmetsp:Transcript_11950/g.17149  ORF Transcript_11950/g.17149 Transcript_11950/m.17149 type:complete len:189 (+) Transcript_11950:1745-2311(+)
MNNINAANIALSSGARGDGDERDGGEHLHTQSQPMSLPTDTTPAGNLNNNAATNGIHPSDYSDDYINDDTKYDFITSASAPAPTPQSSADIIATMLASAHGVHSPRPFQIDAIFQLCIRCVSMLYLIRKTGEGKSLVLKGMATIKRGITLCLVPLVGLGSDQAIKTTCMTCGVEAYHVDEWKTIGVTC